MKTGVLVIGLLCLYMAAAGVISRRGKKYSNSFISSVTAGRETSFPLLLGAAVGSHIGSGFIIGGAEYGAAYGIGGAWYGFGCGFSFILVAFVTARLVYRGGYLSLSEYFRERYQTSSLEIICTVANLLNFMGIFAGQLLAGRAIFYLTGINGDYGVIATAIIAFIYASVSGLWGVMAFSMLQSAVIVLGILAALLILTANNGTGVLITALPASYFELVPFDWDIMVMMTGPALLLAMVGQHTFQRIASAKTEKGAVYSHLIGGLLLLVIALMPPLIGMYGRMLYPDIPSDQIFTTVISEQLPPLLSGVILATIIFAVMSCCNSIFICASTNVIHDIVKPMLRPNITEHECKRLQVITNAVICVLGIALASSTGDMIELMSLGYTFVVAGCIVPFLGGFMWRRGTAEGAMASAILGIGTVLLDFFRIIELPYASIAPLLPSLMGYVTVSIFTAKKKNGR